VRLVLSATAWAQYLSQGVAVVCGTTPVTRVVRAGVVDLGCAEESWSPGRAWEGEAPGASRA
jgi:hypothetical protein